MAKAISHAREQKIPVIYVTVGFREGMPEISANNKSFTRIGERFGKFTLDEFIRIHPKVAPLANEVMVIKKRVSAFTGSDLEVILRSQAIQHVVLTGVATSGVVLSTMREAADKDYRITVLLDACLDGDKEVHELLITKIFPRQADVMTVEDWIRMA